MNSISVLFVGDEQWPEFHDVHRWLAEKVELRTARDVESAVILLSDGAFDPVLIVLARAWPGQIQRRHLERLRRLAPLARVCELLGSWCEGETLSGRPLGGTFRIY